MEVRALVSRLVQAQDAEIRMTQEEWMLAKLTADRRMKATNGHSFLTILKTRCQFCGRSPRAKGRCSAWFQGFLHQLDVVLMNLDREREEWSKPLPAPPEGQP